jgi:hypothetical protein
MRKKTAGAVAAFGVGVESLVVGPKRACVILSVGTTRLYEMLNADPPELESYLEGRARRITTASLIGYVQRQLSGATPPRRNPHQPPIRQHEPVEAARVDN